MAAYLKKPIFVIGTGPPVDADFDATPSDGDYVYVDQDTLDFWQRDNGTWVKTTDRDAITDTDSAGTGAAPVTGAQTLDVSDARTFHRVKGDNGGTWTFTNVPTSGKIVLIIEQDDVGTRLKPTLAGFTFHTNGTGGTGGALPTLSTTAGLVDVFTFEIVGVNAYLAATSLGVDEA